MFLDVFGSLSQDSTARPCCELYISVSETLASSIRTACAVEWSCDGRMREGHARVLGAVSRDQIPTFREVSYEVPVDGFR